MKGWIKIENQMFGQRHHLLPLSSPPSKAMFIVLQVLEGGSLNQLKRILWLAWATYQALKMHYQSWQTPPALKAFQKQQLFYEGTNFPSV